MKHTMVIVTYRQDKGKWELVQDWKVETNDEIKIVVPKGFLTDFASIPRITSPIRYSFEYSLEGPLLHDYLYSVRGAVAGRRYSRKECDKLFYQMMKEKMVPLRARLAAYWSVRLFGWRYW